MSSVLPVVVVCSLGIVFCLAYLVYLLIKCCKKDKKVECFDFDENTLTIHLDKKGNVKK